MSTLSLYQGDLTKQVGAGEKTDRQRHVKTKRCCQLLPTLKGSGLAKGSVTQ